MPYLEVNIGLAIDDIVIKKNVALIGLFVSPIRYYWNKMLIDDFIDGCKTHE